MANSTAIEWTDATWNPVTGCTKISAGCDHCYAERFSERFRGTPGHPFESGRRGAPSAFGVGELRERGFLQFLTEAFNVHSIAYYDLSLIVAIS